MPYVAAKMTVQSVGTLTSRRLYWEWHDEIHPYYIPKMPHRVYSDWVSWNDFLGVENTWDGHDRKRNKHTRWMPYWEAVRCVQKMKFKTKAEYRQAYEEGLIPNTIPLAPDRVYEDVFTGWVSFLGKDIEQKVSSAENVVGILCFCSSNILPPNVIELIIAPEGRGQLQDKLEGRSDLRPIKAYMWDSDVWPRVKSVLTILGTCQEPNVYLFANVNAVWYELDNILMMYRY